MTFTGLSVLLAVVGAANLYLLVLLFRYLRTASAEQLESGRRLQVISDDSDALCQGMIRMGEQLQRLEVQLSRLGERQERRELSDPLEREYGLAEKMLASGEPLERIMSECGMVRSEVELLMRMHEKKSQAGFVRTAQH